MILMKDSKRTHYSAQRHDQCITEQLELRQQILALTDPSSILLFDILEQLRKVIDKRSWKNNLRGNKQSRKKARYSQHFA